MSQEKDLEFVRQSLRKAADVKDPRDMWFVVRDILNLLTEIVTSKPMSAEEVVTATRETLPG